MNKLLTWIFFFISFSLISQNESVIPIEGGKLHYKTYGEGKPLLIINGGPGMSSEGFASLAKELGKNYLAILYDQRGTGASSMNEINAQTMTMDLMVKDIETLRMHLKIDNWTVLGHSFGGMLASYYVSKHPKKVKGLILSSSGGVDLSLLSSLNLSSNLNQKERDSLAYWTHKIQNGDTSHHAAIKRGTYLAPAYLYDKKLVPMIAERLTQGNMAINGFIWEDMRSINFDCKVALKNFKNPVLIIQGKQDVLDKSIAEKTHQLFSNSELYYIDKSAHYAWLEQPKLYFGKINSFLSRLN